MVWMANSLLGLIKDLDHQASERRHNRKPVYDTPRGECFGLCPICHQIVSVKFAGPQDSALCPRCHQVVNCLEPLDPS